MQAPTENVHRMLQLEVTQDEAWEIHCALDAVWTKIPSGDYRQELLKLSNRVRDAMERPT